MQYRFNGPDMAHYLGSILKWVGIAAFFFLSATLSWGFWSGFIPYTSGWFPYSGMGLTEGGFVLWMAVFMLTRHNPFAKVLAMIMVVVSGITCFMIAFYEFTNIMGRHSAASVFGNADTINNLTVFLGIVFLTHGLVFVTDMFHAYFSRPGNFFRNPAPPQNANLIRTNNSHNANLIRKNAQSGVTVQEVQDMVQQYVTGYLTALPGGDDEPDPLAQRRLPRPRPEADISQEQEAEAVTLAQVGEIVKGAVSGLTKKAWHGIKRGTKGGDAPGNEKTNTLDDSSSPTGSPSGHELTDLDVWNEAYSRSPLNASMTLPEFVKRMKGIEDDPQVGESVLEQEYENVE